MVILKAIDRAITKVVGYLSWIACVVLGAMVLMVSANVFGRYFLHKPLMGTVELVELSMATIAVFAIPFAAIRKSHVRIDLIINRAPVRFQKIAGSLMILFSLGIFAVITYEAIINAITYISNLDDATFVLFIPYAPFRTLLAIGFLLLCLALLFQIPHPPVSPPPEKGTDK